MWSAIIQAVMSILTALIKNKEKAKKLREQFLRYIDSEENKTESKDLNEDYKKQLNEMNKDDKK